MTMLGFAIVCQVAEVVVVGEEKNTKWIVFHLLKGRRFYGYCDLIVVLYFRCY